MMDDIVNEAKLNKGIHMCIGKGNCSECEYKDGDSMLTCKDLMMDMIYIFRKFHIVKCGECKHQKEVRTGKCPYYTTNGVAPPDDWYCADGVKKYEI